ncbi:MAG: MaoC family dehydratase [Haloarculaceae archaeon]
MRYFEDIEAGQSHDLGSHTFTEAGITAFAREYDPQPFHVDPEAARESSFGELIASGWHTASVCMRLLVENYLNDTASAGARGVRELRWHAPVRPGDTISCRVEVLETEPASNPHIGNVVNRLTGHVDGDLAVEWTADAMFERREVRTE